jgi:hypothetical protein
VAHPVDRALEDRHVRAQPERDDRRVVADDAAADHEHAAGRHAGYPSEQEPPPAERLFEEVRAGLSGEAAGDLAHRSQQRERMVVRLHSLVGDAGRAALGERAGEVGVRGQVEVREQHLAFAEERVLGLERLLHLEQELRVLPDL